MTAYELPNFMKWILKYYKWLDCGLGWMVIWRDKLVWLNDLLKATTLVPMKVGEEKWERCKELVPLPKKKITTATTTNDKNHYVKL